MNEKTNSSSTWGGNNFKKYWYTISFDDTIKHAVLKAYEDDKKINVKNEYIINDKTKVYGISSINNKYEHCFSITLYDNSDILNTKDITVIFNVETPALKEKWIYSIQVSVTTAVIRTRTYLTSSNSSKSINHSRSSKVFNVTTDSPLKSSRMINHDTTTNTANNSNNSTTTPYTNTPIQGSRLNKPRTPSPRSPRTPRTPRINTPEIIPENLDEKNDSYDGFEPPTPMPHTPNYRSSYITNDVYISPIPKKVKQASSKHLYNADTEIDRRARRLIALAGAFVKCMVSICMYIYVYVCIVYCMYIHAHYTLA